MHILQYFVCHPLKAFAMAEPQQLFCHFNSNSFPLSLLFFSSSKDPVALFISSSKQLKNFKQIFLNEDEDEDEDEDPFIVACVLVFFVSNVSLFCYHRC